ncbi:MAG: hypothetical protein GWM89_01105 [Candidatus Dadabacteria bacterium]|nr:hypothetical protein [Candidatus Dadabacteria bacterium]NIV41370.1 hypothetical protein [Candidatus Dadabacteria bacterium]NIX14577.1 hypothetical protein [Candidatus Dadabacteria bacterium]NIY21032.1 hypothetical protein [Candidatus Dadabacteria bacterium]
MYHSIPKVAVKIFNDDEKDLAENKYNYLKKIGITTVENVCVKHTDNKNYHYVFAELSEFLNKLENTSVKVSF